MCSAKGLWRKASHNELKEKEKTERYELQNMNEI